MSDCQIDINQKTLAIENPSPERLHLKPSSSEIQPLDQDIFGVSSWDACGTQCPLVTARLKFLPASLLCQFGPWFYLQLAGASA